MFLIYHWLLRDNFVNKDVDYTLRTVLNLYFIDKHFTRTIIYIYNKYRLRQAKRLKQQTKCTNAIETSENIQEEKKIEYLQDLYGNSGKKLKN